MKQFVESQLTSANVLFPFSRLRIKKDDVHISVLTSGVDIKVIFAPAIVSSSPNDVNSVKKYLFYNLKKIKNLYIKACEKFTS